jgi:oligopeptide/dipeptide ABC transporter ATP-binding protein
VNETAVPSRIPGPGTSDPILSATDLVVDYRVRGRRNLRAVDHVSVSVSSGETLGIVGESGCGKSSLAKALLGLVPLSHGQVVLNGSQFSGLSERERRPLRRHIQMVFQDSASSLHPNRRIGALLREPLLIHAAQAGKRPGAVDDLLDAVGLGRDLARAYPEQLSGGQRQRVNIARAIATHPEIVVADEPTSSLDVSIQAQILNLMLDLQEKRYMAYVFISHDLSVVRHMSHRVGVMYGGQIVELGTRDTFDRAAIHPYTRLLTKAVTGDLGKRAHQTVMYQGEPAEAPGRNNERYSPLTSHGTECVYTRHCPFVEAICRQSAPALREVADNHFVACHFAESLRTMSRRAAAGSVDGSGKCFSTRQ